MKLTSVNKILLTLFSVSLFACHQKNETEFLVGNWKYLHIQKNGATYIEVLDNDHLTVKSDNTFEYNIESVKKQMKGRALEHDIKYNIWVFIKCFFYLPRWYYLTIKELIFKNK